ncbi:MAG: SspB family protein [Brevirhabdus sp.]
MTDTIDYGNLMHDAMRRLIATVLDDVGQNGLPGDHHFYITYDTTHPGIQMPDWMKERYPSEITIVIQHQFEDLSVDENGFHITLSFGDQPVPLYVHFDALLNFVDPSVEFGLVFRHHDEDDDEDAADLHIVDETEEPDIEAPQDSAAAAPKDAEVVSLDSFRK